MTIPEGVTSIGNEAFARSALISITIPAGVTFLENHTFAEAASLESITFAAGLTGSKLSSIGSDALRGTQSLKAITIGGPNSNFKTINGVLFNGDGTSLLHYPRAKTGAYTIPNGVTSIAESAFNASIATSIYIPASVRSVGDNAFANTSLLKSVTFEPGIQLTGISDYMFYQSAITSIRIPASVTEVGDGAFSYASALTSVTIPASVTSIGEYAFSDAPALTSIYFLGSAPENIGDSAFENISSSAKAYVKTGVSSFGSTWAGLVVTVGVYTVTYNTSGGSAVTAQDYGANIATPTSPTRTGYTFAGWSATNGGSTITFPYTPVVKNDVTLFAKWTPISPNAAVAKTSSVPKFAAGASSLSKSGKAAIQKIVKKSGADATYTIIGEAGKSNGVPARFVKALAMARAEKVKAHLLKLGVKKSNITIKLKIVESGITPKTAILAKYLTK
jgi:uncharacterized repeat protein (TIGR02543 family)